MADRLSAEKGRPTLADVIKSYDEAVVIRVWGPTLSCSCGFVDMAGRLSVLGHAKRHREKGERVLIAFPEVDKFPELREDPLPAAESRG